MNISEVMSQNVRIASPADTLRHAAYQRHAAGYAAV